MTKRILICLLLSVTFIIAQDNLLLNFDLESGYDNWYPSMHPDSLSAGMVQEWCSDCGIEGSGGFHIFAPPGTEDFIGFLQLNEAVTPGKKYCFAVDVKYEALKTPVIAIVFLDSLNKLIESSDVFPLIGSSDWRRITGYYIAPNSARSIGLAFGSSEGRCEAWIDNCFLGIGDTTCREISVDYAEVIDTIRNLSGTNRGPINPDAPLDLTDKFGGLKLSIARTHDWYGPGDRHVLFPNWEADPTDPANYNFNSSDTFITGIVDAGAEVFFRLGESWEAEPVYNVPPPDNTTWAKVCKHIVMHYNAGWADGFHYDIKYWEIWNEPDIEWFWDGTYEEYYDMYIEVAETLKAYDSTLSVGGLSMADPTNVGFIKGMLDAIDSTGAPFDFFSWHRYDNGSAFNYVLINRWLEQCLAEYGFDDTELILNEWNLAWSLELDWLACNSPYNAAIAAGVLALMQRENVAEIMRYRTDNPIFGFWGDAGGLTYSGYAYRLISELYNHHLMLKTGAFDSTACAVLAGKSDDGNSMVVLFTDWHSNHEGYELTISSLPGDVEYKWKVYALDNSLLCESFDSGMAANETLVLSEPMRAPAINLIHITNINSNIKEFGTKNDVTEKIVISPNPFNKSCRIEGAIGTEYEIYDLEGGKVAQSESSNFTWMPNENLISGVYILKVMGADGGEAYSRRLVYLK